MMSGEMLLVNTEGFRFGRVWAKDRAVANDADFAAFLTQKYRYMPPSSPPVFVLGCVGVPR